MYQGKTVFEGTKRELFEANPTWWKYAREIGEPEEEEDRLYNTRSRTSSRRYDLTEQGTPRIVARPNQRINIPPRAHRVQETEDIPLVKPKRQRRGFRAHPLLYLGIGMLAMLLLWQGGTALGTWWQLHNDDSTYGRPRTAQYDVVVGHNDDEAHKTHIIVVNLNAHIVIIEIPGGDTSKSRVYSGPHLYGNDADLAPITLTFKDVNGDGHLDMLVNVQGGHLTYLNQRVNGVWQFVLQQTAQ